MRDFFFLLFLEKALNSGEKGRFNFDLWGHQDEYYTEKDFY